MRIEWERVNVLVCTVYGAVAKPEVRFAIWNNTPQFLVRIEEKRFNEGMGREKSDLVVPANSFENALEKAKVFSETLQP